MALRPGASRVIGPDRRLSIRWGQSLCSTIPMLKSETEQVLGCHDLGVFDKVVLALDFISTGWPPGIAVGRTRDARRTIWKG